MRGWRRRRGMAAETLVLRTAERDGWQCLARNYTTRRGEIDLILVNCEQLLVVEVRYRGRSDFGQAVETVAAAKQARIIAATRAFIATHPMYAEFIIRFDVVGVGPEGRLHWVQDAFQVE